MAGNKHYAVSAASPVRPIEGWRRGAALIIVLAFLVLVTILVVAFFMTVSTEYGAARTNADLEAGRQLADTANQIVMGQIRDATTSNTGTWASQPGMVRTYDAGGNALEAFALYSSAQMRRSLSGSGFDPGVDLPSSSWQDEPSRWVDLNAPIIARGNRVSFPIIDPRAAAVVSGSASLIDGFGYDATAVAGAVAPANVADDTARLPMPVRWIYVLRDGTLTVPLSGSGSVARFEAPEPIPTASNPVVGRIAFWTDDETCKLNINTAVGGVPWDTPIGNSGLELLFARYQPAKNEFSRYPGHPATISLAPALWRFLGLSSPSASQIPSFAPPPAWRVTDPFASGPSLAPAAASFRDRVLPLVPRNSFGGSEAATVSIADVRAGTKALAAVDSDRLFVSSDEILFGPNEEVDQRNANLLNLQPQDVALLRFFLTAQSRAPELNPFGLPKICLWPLPDPSRQAVANANASATDTRSSIDRLIAFCTTLNFANGTKKREYAFARYDSTRPAADFQALNAAGTANNAVIYAYLEALWSRPLPGFGGSLVSRYGAGGTRQILTNIYDFIRSQVNLIDTAHSASSPASAQNLDSAFVSRYAYAANISGPLESVGINGRAGHVIPARLPNGTQGGGRFPVVSQVALQFIARATDQPPVTGNTMHPWVPNGTGGIQAYPTMDLDSDGPASVYDATRVGRFATHPGLRFLTLPDGAGGSFTLPNPRYRGPDLSVHQTEVEPTLLVGFSIPSAGVPGYKHPFRVRVSGLANLRVGGVPLFPGTYDTQIATINNAAGVLQFNVGPSALANQLFFVGNPVVVGQSGDFGATFEFQGGSFRVELLNPFDNSVVQTYNLTFPAAIFPTPLLPNALPSDNRARDSHSFWSSIYKPTFPPVKVADLPPSSLLTFDGTSDLATNPNFGGASGFAATKTRRSFGTGAGFANMILPQWPVVNDYRGKLSSDTVRAMEVAYGDTRLLTQMSAVPTDFFLPHRFYYDSKMRAAHTLRDFQFETNFEPLQGATLQYLTPSYTQGVLPTYGTAAWNSGHPNPGNLWDVATGEDVQRMAYSYFVNSGPNPRASLWPFSASTLEFDASKFGAYKTSNPTLSGLVEPAALWRRGGDFSSGFPGVMDASLTGKVDEGNFSISNRGIFPYFNELSSTAVMPPGPNLFSPNRQVPSPVVLGSLPAGYSINYNPSSPRLVDVTPWRTLLFAPNPVGIDHESLASVRRGGNPPLPGVAPDFTILDFFWMPIVEPYALSEPLSTAGKVNMNVQIAPFTYITRDTALRGVFLSTLVTAVPDKWLNNKNATGSGSGILSDVGGNSAPINYANFRYPINATETLKQFKQRFNSGDLFRSPSEICSLWLYPDRRSSADSAGPSWDSSGNGITTWWYANPGNESKSVTGDNLRERPYGTLYPLLTTRSNTYTVHVKVQTLQKVPGTNANEWVEGRDRVTSEYQGSQTIERYVDPTDPKMPDFATSDGTTAPTVNDYYRFRVISAKRFTP